MDLGHTRLFIPIFVKLWKNKLKRYLKHQTLGHQPSDPAYYIKDCRILRRSEIYIISKKIKSSCRLLDQHHAKNWTLKQKFQQRKEVGRLCHEKGSILMTREIFFLCRSNYFLISHYLATSKSMKRIVALIHSEYVCAIFFFVKSQYFFFSKK